MATRSEAALPGIAAIALAPGRARASRSSLLPAVFEFATVLSVSLPRQELQPATGIGAGCHDLLQIMEEEGTFLRIATGS